MKSILIVIMMLLLSGCEDVNTFCAKDTNDSNSSDINCSDINCTDYCSIIDWKDINSSNTTCLSYCNCSPEDKCSDLNGTEYCDNINWEDLNNSDTTCLSYFDCKPEPTIDCEQDEYRYCKIITDDQNNSNYLCSNNIGFDSTCNFADSECDCSREDNLSNSKIGYGCTCHSGENILIASSAIHSFNSNGGNDDMDGDNGGTQNDSDDGSNKNKTYIMHTDVKAALFWIGEKDENNDTVQKSNWDSNWLSHYRGTDTPDSRNIYHPAGFTPDENPFYAALPYNDLGADGERKHGADGYIPWATEEDDPYESICKNRWVKILGDNNIAYAQWEDVGPYGDGTDINYVFGGKEPLNSGDANGSGITISPAVRDYLLGSGSDVNNTILDWVFVEEENVPNGPWREKITDRLSD